jgi:DNA-binding protein HU-beta
MPQEVWVNKSELVEAIAEQTGLTKADSERALSALIEIVQNSVRGGDKVTLPGFGSFSVTERKARTGRNPQTGASIKIAASKAPKFTAGSAFKNTVNSKGKVAKAAPAKAAKKAPAKKGK